MGEIDEYLGIQITRDRRNRSLSISMKHYIDKMLNTFGMSNCNVRQSPMEYRFIPSHDMSPTEPDDIAYMKTVPYSNAIGTLMYLAITCRPDISYAVSVFSRFNANPGRRHWEGVKDIFRYLKGTSSLGITYGGNRVVLECDRNVLISYSDSDWAGCPDSRKSVSGYCVMLNGGPVQWKAQAQTIIAMSSTEAECIAAATVCNELVWMKRIMHFLGYIQNSTKLYIDNKSAICIASATKDDRRTRHIDVRYHLIKGLVSSKQIILVHISGLDNPADIFTKPETIKSFLHMRNILLRF